MSRNGLLISRQHQKRIAELKQQLTELREAAITLAKNSEWDGDISTVETSDLKALSIALLQESKE